MSTIPEMAKLGDDLSEEQGEDWLEAIPLPGLKVDTAFIKYFNGWLILPKSENSILNKHPNE